MKTSGCCFIKNNQEGAYALWESIATILPLIDELVILDLGSTDGTLEYLKYISAKNSKIKILHGQFPENKNASDFAVLANQVIQSCENERVIYWQADEIWHQDLLVRLRAALKNGLSDLSFWRIQYRENFQVIKWLPHIVHRVGLKNNFHFATEEPPGVSCNTDGMNSDRYGEAQLLSAYHGGWFPKWGEIHKAGGDAAIYPYVNDMIMDVSQVGGFIDNIRKRREHHIDFWHESMNIEQENADQWLKRELQNSNWTKTVTPLNLPAIMRFHVGQTTYKVRADLIDAIADNKTHKFLF